MKVTILLVIASLLLLPGPGYCAKAKISPDEMCTAELDSVACTKIQGWLEGYGHFFQVIEGVACATYNNAKKGNMAVLLRCADKDGNEFIIKVALINNKIVSIVVERTGGRVIKT